MNFSGSNDAMRTEARKSTVAADALPSSVFGRTSNLPLAYENATGAPLTRIDETRPPVCSSSMNRTPRDETARSSPPLPRSKSATVPLGVEMRTRLPQE